MVVVNHGVPRTLIDECFAAARQFFDRDEAYKLALKAGNLNIGYLPYPPRTQPAGTDAMAPKPSLNETFYIVNDLPPDDPRIVSGDPIHGLNRWPPAMPAFRATMLAYIAAAAQLAETLTSAVATALGLAPDYFAEAFTAEPTRTLRLTRYLPQFHAQANQVGFAPHIDNNFLTLLAQSDLPGLEVRTVQGDWIRPIEIEGAFVVNTGEMLSRYSNDRFTATPHRVVNSNRSARHAIPFFYGPGMNATVAPVATCVSPDNPPKYTPLHYGEFRRELLLTDYAGRLR